METPSEQDLVAKGIFYALFRVVEIEELSGAERAVEWARSAVEDPELCEGLAVAVRERASDARQGP